MNMANETKSVFWYWGRWMYRYRRFVVTAAILLFVGLAMFAKDAPELLNDNGFTPRGSDSDVGQELLQQRLELPRTSVTVVYEGITRDVNSPESRDDILQSLAAVSERDDVTSAQFVSAMKNDPASNIVAVNIALTLDTDEALLSYPDIRSQIVAPDGMKMHITGGTAVLYDMQHASKNDIVKAEIIGLPIALIVLLIVFGTIVAAVLPMVVGVMSVTLTLGVVYFIAQSASLSNFMPNMVTMLGLAVGIDYALFIVSRFREELRIRDDIESAVATTCQTAGKSIFFSGVAVLIGLFSMLFIDLTIFRSLSLGGVLVVSFSVLTANTLLLSLLGMLGHRINKLYVIPKRWRRTGQSVLWKRIAHGVMKRPVAIVIVLTISLVYFMMPMLDMKLGVPNAEVLPPSYESRHGSDLLYETYNRNELEPIQIAVQAGPIGYDEEGLRRVVDYISKIELLPEVEHVSRPLIKDDTALVVVVPKDDPQHENTVSLVRELRQMTHEGLTTYVTGAEAYRMDIVDRINERIVLVVGFVMVVTYVVLLFAFRSVLLPLKAVLMNMLSLGASLGIVVSVVQEGHLADLLNITAIGQVNAILPVIIFCVVFGISMDYEVFLLSRIIEEYEKTGDNEYSTASGLMRTGSLITSAAFILIVVVGSFLFTDIEIMKALGLGLALAVLLDATIIRVLLVPAFMKLLGRANWWAPGWIKSAGRLRKEAG